MAGNSLHDLYTYGLTQRFPTTVTRPGTGTWSRSKWDQKSCQLSKFDSVLVGHGTKNANKPWLRDLRPKKLGTTGLTYQVTSPFDCKSSLLGHPVFRSLLHGTKNKLLIYTKQELAKDPKLKKIFLPEFPSFNFGSRFTLFFLLVMKSCRASS